MPAGPATNRRIVEHGDLYAVFPERARRGVVVLHEILGRQPEIERVVHRFADRGYAAAAPHLFAGGPLCIARLFAAAASGEGAPARQVLATRDFIALEAALAPANIGVVGFCLSGGFALAMGRSFGAVSTNYGDVPATEVMRGIGPVIACYGGRDRAFQNAEKLETRLAPLGVRREIHVFPEAGHSFLTDGRHPIASFLTRPVLHLEATDAAVRAEAWSRIFAFFDSALSPS